MWLQAFQYDFLLAISLPLFTSIALRRAFAQSMENRGMDRDAAIEAIIAFVGVGIMAAAIIYIGSTFGDGEIQPEGGLILVGAIAGFILMMGLIGLFLSRRYE